MSRRITTLKRMKVLSDSADVLNYQLIGFGVRAVVELSVPIRIASSLKQSLLKRPEVLAISVIAGDGLLSLDVIAVDMDHLHVFVRSLQESGETTTKIVFAEEKSRLTLVDRVRLLNEESVYELVRV